MDFSLATKVTKKKEATTRPVFEVMGLELRWRLRGELRLSNQCKINGQMPMKMVPMVLIGSGADI